MERFHPESIYFAVNRNNTGLLAELDRAHTELGHENPLLHSQLIQRYYYATYSTIPKENELGFIENAKKSGKVFRALIDPDRFPLVRLKDGKLDGIQYDVVQKIISRTGLDIRVIPCASHDEYTKIRASGGFDILLDANYDFAQAEKNALLLCSPYLATPVSILGRKDGASSSGKIALVENSEIEDLLVRNGVVFTDKVYFSSIKEAADAVRSGVADKAYLYTRTCQRTHPA